MNHNKHYSDIFSTDSSFLNMAHPLEDPEKYCCLRVGFILYVEEYLRLFKPSILPNQDKPAENGHLRAKG